MTNELTIYDKLEIFYKQNTFVHLVLKSGSWYNCTITTLSTAFIEIQDRRIGYKLVFIDEIAKAESYIKEVKDGNAFRS